MGSELFVDAAAAAANHRVKKFFDDLEAQKAILTTSTSLFAAISDHFAAIQTSLAAKSESLDARIAAFDSSSRQTLASLSLRDAALPDLEASLAARVAGQKLAAIAEFGAVLPTEADVSLSLKSLCRKMDAEEPVRFVVTKRKDSVALRAAIGEALTTEAVDAARLLLDALEEFIDMRAKKLGVTEQRWACGLLVQALFPEKSDCGEKLGPVFARSVVERAARLVESWKEQMEEVRGGTTAGAEEVVMFIQVVIGFGLKERHDEEFYKMLVMKHAARKDVARVAAGLGFGDIGGVIDEMVKNGKEIEAVYLASEAGLTERFPPISLIKSYLKNSKKNVTTILKNRNNSVAATEESNALELNSIRAVIRCVEDHKLASEFSIDSLRKRATSLERSKEDAKKNPVATSSKSSKKRSHSSGGGGGRGGPGSSSSRPAKAAKYSNAYPSSFNRRMPNPSQQLSQVTRYPTVYTAAPISYGNSYGVARAQSPVGLPQQHIYSLTADSSVAASSVLRSGGSYGAQASYGGPYDYANATQPSYQPPSYQQ